MTTCPIVTSPGSGSGWCDSVDLLMNEPRPTSQDADILSDGLTPDKNILTLFERNYFSLIILLISVVGFTSTLWIYCSDHD